MKVAIRQPTPSEFEAWFDVELSRSDRYCEYLARRFQAVCELERKRAIQTLPPPLARGRPRIVEGHKPRGTERCDTCRRPLASNERTTDGIYAWHTTCSPQRSKAVAACEIRVPQAEETEIEAAIRRGSLG